MAVPADVEVLASGVGAGLKISNFAHRRCNPRGVALKCVGIGGITIFAPFGGVV